MRSRREASRAEGSDGSLRILAVRPKRPVLLAVDQQLGEVPTLGVAPEHTEPVGPLEVGEHEDVEQLGAGSPTPANATVRPDGRLFQP